MKALCRNCRTVGPTIPSVAESKAAAEAHGWRYARRRGFLCSPCYLDDLGRRIDRAEKVFWPLAGTVVALKVLALVLYAAHLIFET